MDIADQDDWMGAKLALFLGPDLLVIQRDDVPHITWPGAWDLPGGGREAGETPLGCALRETREEVSLILDPNVVTWGNRYLNSIGRGVWFFVAHLEPNLRGDVRLGDEGQSWTTMSPESFLEHPNAVAPFKPRLCDYLSGKPTGAFELSLT